MKNAKWLVLGFGLAALTACEVPEGAGAQAPPTVAEQRAKQREENFARMRAEQEARTPRNAVAPTEQPRHEVAESEDESRARQRVVREKLFKCFNSRKGFNERVSVIAAGGQVDTFFGDVAQREASLAAARKQLTEVVDQFEEVCGDDKKPDDHLDTTKATDSLAGFEKRIAEEKVCRPSKECMAKRLAEHVALDALVVCRDVEDLKEAAVQVGRIRANGARAGVVNLHELKEASDHVLVREGIVRDHKAWFNDRWKRAWAPALCPKEK